MVDANYATDQVFSFAAKSPLPCLPSHGRYYGARHKPIQYAKPEAGERMGPNWRIPAIRPHRQSRAVIWDVNRWKSDLRRALASSAGTHGAWHLPHAKPKQLQLLAEHLLSEYATRTSGPYGDLEEWSLKPNEDNHLLDCCVGSLVGASIMGIAREGVAQQDAATKAKRRKRSVKF